MAPKYPVTSAREIMYDSTEAASLPAGTVKAAGYVNGAYPSHAGMIQRFPQARVRGIDVLGDGWEAACILDYEEGNPAWKNPALVRRFITSRNQAFPETACVYCPAGDLDDVEGYAEGLWHVLWVANWGENGAVGESLTGTRSKAGNLIVATQLQNNKTANWDLSDTLASW